MALPQSGAWPNLFSICTLIKNQWLLRLLEGGGTQSVRDPNSLPQQSSSIRREGKCGKHLACQPGMLYVKAVTAKRSPVFTSGPLLAHVAQWLLLNVTSWGRTWHGIKANIGLLNPFIAFIFLS